MSITTLTSTENKSALIVVSLVAFLASSFFGATNQRWNAVTKSLVQCMELVRHFPPLDIREQYANITYEHQALILNYTLPFWEDHYSIGNILPSSRTTYGPCYLPSNKINWVSRFYGENVNEPVEDLYPNDGDISEGCLSNMCRPGFLIIGAGKAGTSSLYKYLVNHNRVLPAKTKQVQFFKYHYEKGMHWYLSHFPTAAHFLSSGALMTGEAAPGYLPYPEVAIRTRTMMPGAKILLTIREPLDRAWSSYNYNYFIPGLQHLKTLQENEDKDERYLIDKHLFSFEDMVKAELNHLLKCIKPGGDAEEEGLKQSYWANDAMDVRKRGNLPAMMDIINGCYGTQERRDAQWKDLKLNHPEGLLDLPNIHRLEGMIARGLYAFQAEWWYAAFPREDIHVICSDEMKHETASILEETSDFLGLPYFDYSSVVSKGMYNVRGHEGYGKVTAWKTETREKANDEIPLSPLCRSEIDLFLQGQNERLYLLTGKRCSWQ